MGRYVYQTANVFFAIALACCFTTQALSIERSAFSFEGNETFDDSQLIHRLYRDTDFHIANHPMAFATDLPKVVKERLELGYSRCGFPDAKVTVQLGTQSKKATVTIEEGPRYRCAGLQVIGAKSVDVAALTERLTKPYPDVDLFPTFVMIDGEQTVRWVNKSGKAEKLEKGIWENGKPVAFRHEDGLQFKLDRAFSDLGFSRCKATAKIKIVPHQATPTADQDEDRKADLIVKIEDEGPRDTIDDIVVTGTDRNSIHDVITFLGLESGMPVNRMLLQTINEKLWASGRFVKQQVTAERTEGLDRLELKIELEEFPFVPLLSEPINREGKAALEARVWVSEFVSRGDDLVCEMAHDAKDPNSDGGVLIVQSKSGGLIKVTLPGTDGEAAPYFALLADGKTFFTCFSSLQRKFQGDFALGSKGVELNPFFGAADDPESPMKYGIRGSIRASASGESPVSVATALPPSSFLGLAYHRKLLPRWEGETLILELEGEKAVVFDMENRRFGSNSKGIRVAIEKGRYLREREIIMQDTAGFANDYRSDAPISSCTGYLLTPEIWKAFGDIPSNDELQQRLTPELLLQLSALRHLVKSGTFAAIDSFATQPTKPSEDARFTIPSRKPNPQAMKNFTMYLAADFLVTHSDELFPEGTWPLMVARETGLYLQGEMQHTKAFLKTMRDSKYRGPLCKGTIAALSGFINSELQFQFAVRALQHMDAKHFESDYRELMQGQLGGWIRSFIKGLHAMEAEEVEAFAGRLKNEKLGDLIRKVYLVRELSVDIDSGAVWFEAIKDDLEAWLRSMLK